MDLKDSVNFEILWKVVHFVYLNFPEIIKTFISSLLAPNKVTIAPPPEWPIRVKSLFSYLFF